MNTRLGKKDSLHLYEIVGLKNGLRMKFDVDANSRTQAYNLVAKEGYQVFSVNMVG